MSEPYSHHNAATELDECRAELFRVITRYANQAHLIKELEVDASRYRWLRECCDNGNLTVSLVREHHLEAWSGDNLDSAVDRVTAPEVGE